MNTREKERDVEERGKAKRLASSQGVNVPLANTDDDTSDALVPYSQDGFGVANDDEVDVPRFLLVQHRVAI